MSTTLQTRTGTSGRFSALSITGFVLAFVISVAGLPVSIIAMTQSAKGSPSRALAIAGTIVSICGIVLPVLWLGLVLGAHEADPSLNR